LLISPYQLYASDGTKTGSSILAPEIRGPAYRLVVNNDKNFALVINYQGYDNVSQQSIFGAYSIKNSTDTPLYLGSGISESPTVLKVASKIVLTDSSSSIYKGLITDGTVSGTKFVADLPVGIVDTNTQTIWTSYNSSPYGLELFKITITDSSPALSLVKDINPGQESGYFNQLDASILPNGKLVFQGFTSSTGFELWFSDGTSGGSTSLDLYAGLIGSSPSSFIRFGNKVAFTANVNNWVKGSDTITTGRELVFTDGTTAGTTVLDVYTGSNSSSPVIVGEANSLLYFSATNASGYGFYSTNGTTFTKLADINSSAIRLAWNTSKAFFSLSDSTNGGELWVADFTANSFSLVKDILPGTGSALSGDIGAFMVNNKLVFKAYVSATQQNLFVSDGTSNGTVKIGNTLGSYAALGDTLVFADGNSISASNLSGATPSNVELVNASSAVVKMQSDTDQAFFSLANGDLYATKGTLNTTAKLASSVKNFKVVAENAIYVVTSNSQSPTGYDLWYSDGTLAGTRFVEDVPADVFTNLENAVVIQTVGVNV
jgi:ELWxxDGT repeat protein